MTFQQDQSPTGKTEFALGKYIPDEIVLPGLSSLQESEEEKQKAQVLSASQVSVVCNFTDEGNETGMYISMHTDFPESIESHSNARLCIDEKLRQDVRQILNLEDFDIRSCQIISCSEYSLTKNTVLENRVIWCIKDNNVISLHQNEFDTLSHFIQRIGASADSLSGSLDILLEFINSSNAINTNFIDNLEVKLKKAGKILKEQNGKNEELVSDVIDIKQSANDVMFDLQKLSSSLKKVKIHQNKTGEKTLQLYNDTKEKLDELIYVAHSLAEQCGNVIQSIDRNLSRQYAIEMNQIARQSQDLAQNNLQLAQKLQDDTLKSLAVATGCAGVFVASFIKEYSVLLAWSSLAAGVAAGIYIFKKRSPFIRDRKSTES